MFVLALFSDVARSGGSWMCFDVEEGVRWVCDGLDRCCGGSVVCGVFVGFLSVRDVRCFRMLFEWTELTLVSAATHLCDCGVIRRPVVLGVQQPGTGARVFRRGGEGWGSVLGWAGL